MNRLHLAGGALFAGAIAVVLVATSGDKQTTVEVKVPALSAAAAEGGKLFEANCVACHGRNAGGSQQGPPLVHKIYEPGHHADMSFFRAVGRGVKAHHWTFGDMPPIDGLTGEDVRRIVAYVRELQIANGIR